MADNDEDAAKQVIQHFVSTIERAENIKQGRQDGEESGAEGSEPSSSEGGTQKETTSEEILDEEALCQ